MTINLRDYQDENLTTVREFFSAGYQRVLLQSPTGSGKGILIAFIAMSAKALGNRVMIVTHRDEILQQISATLKALGVKHGVIAAGYREEPQHLVQIASVATLVRRMHHLDPAPDLLIVDEAHHAVAATWRKIIDALPDADIIGFSATPERLDGKGLRGIFDALIIGPTVAELIEAGWLANYIAFAPAVGPDLRGVKTRAGDYAIDQLADAMAKDVIIGAAVTDYTRLCPGVPSIAFCVDRKHSMMVAERFAAAGYKSAHVDGETPREERRRLIAALGTGELQVLTNCGLISEGLDVPGVVALLMLRPTKSLALFLQMIGRALRPAPGKERAMILDHAGNIFRHGLPDNPREWSLNGRSKETKANGKGEAAARRCKSCGVLNPPIALNCSECGETLRERTYREIEAEQLVEIGGADMLRDMSYRAVVAWAGGDKQRLRMIAAARGYKPGWIWHQLQEIRSMGGEA